MLFISHPSSTARSIKHLRDFFFPFFFLQHSSCHASFCGKLISKVIWVRRFCCRYEAPSQKQCNCSYMKRCVCVLARARVCVHVYSPLDSSLPLCLGKCKCVSLSPITAACLRIQFIKDVICSCTINSGFVYFSHLTPERTLHINAALVS